MSLNLRRSILFALSIGCIVTFDARPMIAQQRTPIKVTRLYTSSDGETHAEEVEVALSPSPFADGSSQLNVKAGNLRFLRCPPGWSNDWHNGASVGGRQYTLTLSGRGEVELSDGTRVTLTSGRILLGEDLSGRGHRTRTIGSEDWVSVHVYISD